MVLVYILRNIIRIIRYCLYDVIIKVQKTDSCLFKHFIKKYNSYKQFLRISCFAIIMII